MITKKRLTRIAPLRAGIVLAVFYGFFSLIAVPIILLGAHSSGNNGRVMPFLFVFVPVLYTVGGFIVGAIAAVIYNLIASWTGGLEFETEDVSD